MYIHYFGSIVYMIHYFIYDTSTFDQVYKIHYTLNNHLFRQINTPSLPPAVRVAINVLNLRVVFYESKMSLVGMC